jgi:UDP:flavonoid glycosyltransferase YjiC (YdhE family)
VVGHAGAQPLVKRANLRFWGVGAPSPADLAEFRLGQRSLSAGAAMARAFTDLYVGLYGKAALPGMLTAVEHWRPDVVVRESAELSSVAAADRFGVPHAQVSISLSTQLADQVLENSVARLDELRALAGLPPDPQATSARSRVLTMAPATLEGPSAPRSPTVQRFRDPAAGTGTFDAFGDPDVPLVYLSFGTQVPSPTRNHFPGVYREAVEALEGLPVRVLVAIGDSRDPAELGPVPASVRVRRWVPQAAVMRAATVTVGHGGAGSVLSALAAGVPMALVPFFADQPFNARLMQELGAGLMLEDGPTALEAAVRTLLDHPSFRHRAAGIADEIGALPSVDAAPAALAALVERRQAA